MWSRAVWWRLLGQIRRSGGPPRTTASFLIARMRVSLMVVPGSRLAPLAVALIAAAVAPRVHAQAPNERADLERWRDSLAATADSTGLLSVERRTIELAKSDRGNALVHLKLGFLS